MAREAHPLPDRLLELGRVAGVEVPRDPQQPLALALDQRRAAAIEQRRQVRVRKGVAQDDVGVEVGGVPALFCANATTMSAYWCWG